MSKKSQNNSLQIRNSTAEFLTFAYQAKGDGVEVRVQDGTIWLSQKNMGLLFDTSADNVGLHLKNIFNDSELSEISVAEVFSVTVSDGKNYQVKRYNLDAIIAVGYRVNSKRQIPLTMEDWAKHLDLILQANGKDLLQNAGKITAEIAKRHAENEFEKYRPLQDHLFESDFDKAIKQIEN